MRKLKNQESLQRIPVLILKLKIYEERTRAKKVGNSLLILFGGGKFK